VALQRSMVATGTIGSESFDTTSGVKQGGSSSVKLFTAYIDPTIDAVNSLGPDDWLENTHILLLMDDTAIMATSREKMAEKLNTLKTKAEEIGMILHPTKCQYITVNTPDSEPFIFENVTISQTTTYTYLGAMIENSSIAQQVSRHMAVKQAHTRKFTSFLTKNSEAPYSIKVKVWNSAMNAAILYSSETWLTANLQCVESSYVSSIKQMLSVRNTTCNDLVYIESGLTNAKSHVFDRQVKFLHNLRARHKNDYIINTIEKAKAVRSPMGKRIKQLEQTDTSHKESFVTKLKETMATSDSSRRKQYIIINPHLEPSPFLNRSLTIPEHNRIAANRLRLGSHRLKIETGRWSRTPVQDRICVCGTGIQTEEHVMLVCPRSYHLRTVHNLHAQSLHELFDNDDTRALNNIAEYSKKILSLFRT
jgi:hypothetical protein